MSNIKFKCPKCGSDEFKLPRSDIRNTDKITCVKCGFRDTYERIVGPQAQKLAEDEFKKEFKELS